MMISYRFHPDEKFAVFLVNGIFLVDSNTSIFVVSEYQDGVT